MRGCSAITAVVMGLALLVSASGCDGGGGGGPAASFTMTVDGEFRDLSAVAVGQYSPGTGGTTVAATDTIDIAEVIFPGAGVGTFADPVGGAGVMYVTGTGTMYLASDSYGSYSIEITECGPVGGTVAGTFSASLVDIGDPLQTVEVDGAFSVARWPD